MSIVNDSSILLHFLSGASCAGVLAAAVWPLSTSQQTQLWRHCHGVVGHGDILLFRLGRPVPVLAVLSALVLGGAA